MITYTLTSSGQFGAAPSVNPLYPTVAPRAPSVYPGAPPVKPQIPTAWTTNVQATPQTGRLPSKNTSSNAALDWWDQNQAVPAKPMPGYTAPEDGIEPNPVMPTVYPDPTFATELAPSRIMLSPLGFVAAGAVLVGLWAAFRKR